MNIYPNCLYVTGFLILVVFSIHLFRKDKHFILTTGSSPMWIYISEYTFFTLPLLLVMLISSHWYCVFLLFPVYLIISLFNYMPKSKMLHRNPFIFIPDQNFEWKAGVRKNLWIILFIYLLAIGLLYYKYASLIILWLLLAVIASFYQECEPLNILELQELPSNRFISHKIKLHLKSYMLFSSPIIVGSLLLHPDTTWIALFIFVLSLVNLSLFILSKYALYEPRRNLSANNFLNTLIHLSILIPVVGPFLFPIPLLMSIRAYKRSLYNLKYYLDAYH